ncbi:MAG: MarR family transcriptional regulator [Syntrophaceae bacterium]
MSRISRQEIDDVLFHALMAVYRFEWDKIKRFGLGYMEILALQVLRRRSPLRMRELVKELGLPFSSATRLFSRLETAGYVNRVYAQDDRRGVHIHLTQAGDDIVRKIEAHSFEILNANTKEMDAALLDHFIETARHMEKLLAVRNSVLKSIAPSVSPENDTVEVGS